MFHQVRLIAYRIADYYDEKTLYRELLLLLEKNNLAFDTGLQYGELRHIAKALPVIVSPLAFRLTGTHITLVLARYRLRGVVRGQSV